MEELLFDTVVYGTGIASSIIAASLTINGQKVLQIDNNPYYGGKYRTLNIKQITQLKNAKELRNVSSLADNTHTTEVLGDPSVHFDAISGNISDMKHRDGEAVRPVETVKFTDRNPSLLYEFNPFGGEDSSKSLYDESSKYGIDLWPKFLYGKSAIVDLLLRSGCDYYLRFGSNDGPLLICSEEDFLISEVPNSKSAIFRDKELTLIEKRTLMKFINELSDFINTQIFTSDSLKKMPETFDGQGGTSELLLEDPDKSWIKFLQEKGLTAKLINLISYGTCLGGKDIYKWTKGHGIARLLKFIESIGVFGESGGSFLYTLYGTADIIQAICRTSAVHGCTFMLNKSIEELKDDGEHYKIKLSGDIQIKTKKIATEYEINGASTADSMLTKKSSTLHVLIVISREKIFGGMNMLVVMPKNDSEEPIYVIQTCCDNGTVATDKYLIHLLVKDNSNFQEFNSFNTYTNPVVERLKRVYYGVSKDLSGALLMIYTTHEIEEEAFGEREVCNDGKTIIYINSHCKSIIPIMDEVIEAYLTVMKILGKGAKGVVDPYQRIDLDGLMDVGRRGNGVEDEKSKNLAMLDGIIDRFF